MRVLFLAIVAMSCVVGVPRPAHAQLSVEDRCKNATAGLVLGMQTRIGIGSSREIALEETGLAPNGPSYRVADQAYRQLAAGTPVATVLGNALAQCRQIGPEAFEDDEVTFGSSREANGRGGGAQLCADVADSIASLLLDDPSTQSMSLDDALQALRSSDPRDIPAPQERKALELAHRQARVNANRQSLQQLVFRHCESLTTAEREALDREFYVP